MTQRIYSYVKTVIALILMSVVPFLVFFNTKKKISRIYSYIT